jgi:hypothetical protein
MTTAQNPHLRNRLLAALSPDDFALLAPHLREVRLFHGDLLHRPGERIEQVYFLTSGIVSLMAILEGGTTVETVSIGHEGAIGTIEGFGSLHASPRSACRSPDQRREFPAQSFGASST